MCIDANQNILGFRGHICQQSLIDAARSRTSSHDCSNRAYGPAHHQQPVSYSTARRRVILALGAGALAPVSTFSREPGKIWQIGHISLASTPGIFADVFAQRLHELGYVEGKNVAFERRYAAGDVARLPQMAASLVQLKVDVILVATTQIAEVSMRATRTIPIVCPVATDPVGSGLARSLARPGRNVTGLSTMSPEIAGKKLQLLREIIPGLRRVAVLALAHATEPGFATGSRLLLDQLRQAAQQFGIEILPQAAGVVADIPRAFAAMRREKAQAVVVQGSQLTWDEHVLIAELAAKQRLPAAYELMGVAEAGGLISYGPDLVESYRRSAELVAMIFKGTNPGDIPFEQPTKFKLVVNMKTAKTLGVTIPQSILLSADRVIE